MTTQKLETETSTQQPTKTIQSHYNYNQVLEWLENKGKDLFGNQFTVLEQDHPIYFRLMAYFLNDEQTCFQFGIDPSKGILLTGPVGSGKTTIMNLMKYLAPAEQKFYVKPCRDISFEFIQDGYEVIHRYSRGKHNQCDPKIICFDDLGLENNLKYFGNECNVMGEILLSRYDIFIAKKITTHITTNLSATEIEAAYGNRLRSRLRQMVNLIAYNASTSDKR